MSGCQMSAWKGKTDYISACLLLNNHQKVERHYSNRCVVLGENVVGCREERNNSSKFLLHSSGNYLQIIPYRRPECPLPTMLNNVNLREDLISIKKVVLHLFLLYIYPYTISHAYRYTLQHSTKLE